MADTSLTIKKALHVPDTERCSNLGGVASDGSKVWVIKANQAEDLAYIHEFDSLKDSESKKIKITGCGHANGLTYHDGYLYIPRGGSKHSAKGMYRVSVKTWKKENMSCTFAPWNITYFKDDLFIMRTGTSGSKPTFGVFKLSGTSFTRKYTFYVKNAKYSDGYTTNQDIFYHDGKLYIMETKSNLLKSAIVIAKIGTSPTSGKTYTSSDAWLTSASSKWEVETMCCDSDGNVLLGMNTNSDGIYVATNVSVKATEKTGTTTTTTTTSTTTTTTTTSTKEETPLVKYTINSSIKAKHYGSTRKASAIKYIAIHYTGNSGTTATAKGNANYFHTTTRAASAHYVVDEKETVYNCVPDLTVAYAVGGSRYSDYKSTGGAKFYGEANNSNSISIEMVSHSNSSGYYIPEETIVRTAALTRALMKKYGIPESRVIRHFDVNGKPCPACWCGTSARNKLWDKFKAMLSGNVVETTIIKQEDATKFPYLVEINSPDGVLTVRESASSTSKSVVELKNGEVYTIVAEEMNGSTKWGKLKSGAGYISLAYTKLI